MKKKKVPINPLPWYEQIFKKLGLVNTNPKLSPYLNVETFSPHQVKLVVKLLGQGMPLTPPKQLVLMTPEKLGLLLGQQCATLYAFGDIFQPLAVNPEAALKKGEKVLNVLQTKTDVPGVKSALHAFSTLGLMMMELEKYLPRFEKNLHAAFKAALDQPNYQEALAFFRGFAKGMSKPAFKDGQLVGRTDATPIQMKMYMHSEEIAKMKSVKELRGYLLANGFTNETLGDDERLQKLCSRLGFAPGKRGRPRKGNK